MPSRCSPATMSRESVDGDPSVVCRKIAVLGAGGVGKSCLTLQFIQGQFIETYDPTIEDTYRKMLHIGDKAFLLDILDTAGQEEFSSFRTMYIGSGHGFLLVFSVICRQTFVALEAIYEQIVQTKETTTLPILAVGNKCDLAELREVESARAEAWCAEMGGMGYMETSAKTGMNVAAVFEHIALECAKSKYDFLLDDEQRSKKRRKCALL
eukprot:TRINITY_DN7821_c0_g2_i1.p1 TRINITY_DN7821_c0_g2~~TRINITY_DN7821_c0_g2_i1.p1  ORF type:complete len:210 (-),score=77.89 TRINITY_DN7821_c0_g2_i1:522-1151(-)